MRAQVLGRDLIGMPLEPPLSAYRRIYVLPMLHVSASKGTGIVTSVPSDAPDDYQALQVRTRRFPLGGSVLAVSAASTARPP